MRPTLMKIALVAAFSSTISMVSTPSFAHEQSKPATSIKASNKATPAKKLSSGIELQWMDKKVRPQDDFFRFMSGKWIDQVDIPADRGRFGSFDQLRDLSEQQSFQIIKDLSVKTQLDMGSNEQKIADLYLSFMDEAKINSAGVQPLQNDFAKINAMQSKGDLPAMMVQLSRYGVGMPVVAGVSQDAKDSSRHAVLINQGGLSLPDRDYYLKQDDAKMKGFRDAYLVHLAKMLSMAGETQTEAKAQAILNFETELAKIQWSNVENRNPVKTYNKIELSKLPELINTLDWNSYFISNGMANKMDYVIVRQPTYLSKLNQLIADTPLDVWQSYFKWRLLNAYAPFLSQDFVDQDFAFSSVTLRGIPENQARWKRGVARIEESLSEALGQLYVEKHFPAESKARMQVLVNNLLLAYKQSIETLSWMSPETKKQALDKLSKFTPKIGYPDKWRDYSKLSIKRDDLIANIKAGREFNGQRQLAKLGQPVDRSEWGMSPQTVNAYYNARQNEIVFPAAILMPPFFNPNADDAVNYGGIGAVIGHEISHGFDDSGSQSDGDGNLRDWWSKDDKANFGKLADALVEQYGQYSPVPGYKVNGKLTLGENIADNSGLAIAYKAYQLSLNGKKSKVMDGYTGEQRLFMGWAQVWRGKAREAESIRLISTDSHSPAVFRANGPLTNLDSFHQAFKVKPSDKLYRDPKQRITIW